MKIRDMPWAPWRLLVIIAAAVFVTETAIMYLFRYILALGELPEVVFDPLMLVAVLTPVLYYFLFKPMSRLIAEQRVAEQRYRTLFEESPDGILIIDPETTKAIECNEMSSVVLGYPREEILNLRIGDYETIETPAETSAHIDRVLIGDHDDYETVIRKKDGTLRDMHITSRGVRLNGRRVFNAIFRDVTDAKAAKRDAMLMAHLLDAATDSVFVHDLGGNFLYVNRSAFEGRGYTKDELMAMNLKTLDAPEYAALIAPRMGELMEKDGMIFESAHLRKDGSLMPVEVHTRVVEYGGKKVVLSIARDITERRRVLKELEDRINELERFQNATMRRELRMKELSDRVRTLEEELKGARG
ncbi:MAG: PAS domain S-box protein [Deltaproteobacteria bacterium]|nr:PAS domain S-box protein [Deltaproteobacteria bacterium]